MLIFLAVIVLVLASVLILREPEVRRWLATVVLRREGAVRAALGRFQPRDIQRQALALIREKALVSIGYAHLPTEITVLLNPADLDRMGAAREEVAEELGRHVAELNGTGAGGDVTFVLAAKPHVTLKAGQGVPEGTVEIAVAWLEGTTPLTALLPTDHDSTNERGSPRLWITVDGAVPVEVPLSGRMTIGRAPTSTIPINDPSVSRNHAVIVVDDDSNVTIADLGSRNRVEIVGRGNLEPNTPTRIESGDVVSLGRRVRLELIAGSTGASTSSREGVDAG